MFETLITYWSAGSIYFRLFRFFLILAIGSIITKTIVVPVISGIYSKKSDEARHSIENLTAIITLFITFTVALQAGGFGGLVSVLAAIGAAVTVAIGFGMRDQVSNLVAGILIHLDNPFTKGDYIKVEDTEGVVQNISMRSTTLNGANNKKQIVPNAMVTTGVVKNYTRKDETKVSIETVVGLENSETGSELLLESIGQSKSTLDSPEPEIRYRKIEEDNLYMEANFWVKNSGELKEARSEVLKAYISKMKEDGIIDIDED